MTETQLIHDMAKAHWWRRESPKALKTYAMGILLGADDERSSVAMHRIDKKWAKVRKTEIAAMERALATGESVMGRHVLSTHTRAA